MEKHCRSLLGGRQWYNFRPASKISPFQPEISVVKKLLRLLGANTMKIQIENNLSWSIGKFLLGRFHLVWPDIRYRTRIFYDWWNYHRHSLSFFFFIIFPSFHKSPITSNFWPVEEDELTRRLERIRIDLFIGFVFIVNVNYMTEVSSQRHDHQMY